MATLTDLDAKRGELNAALDAYKQALVDFSTGSITQTDVNAAKANAQTTGNEFGKLISQVLADNPSLTNGDLFSRVGIPSNGRFENVAQIMRYGSLSPDDLIALLGETPGAVFDPTVLSSLYLDDARTTSATVDGDIIAVMDSVGAYSKSAHQTSSGRRPTYNEANGFAFLTLDGTDDWMDSPDLLNADEFTIVFAAKRPNDTRYGRVFDSRGSGMWVGGDTGGNPGIKGVMVKMDNGTGDGPQTVIIEDGNYKAWTWEADVAADTPSVCTVQWNGPASQGLFRINGVTQAPNYQDANMGSVANGGNHRLFAAIDGGQNFAGEFYGAIVAHRVLTTEEIQLAENLLAGRCGAVLAE